MSIAWCCYLEGNVALLRYSYYDNDANEILGKEIFLWRASRVHHDKDDAAGIDVMRCWRKLGNYIDRGSLREGVIQKETVGHDLLEFRYHIIVKYSYLSNHHHHHPRPVINIKRDILANKVLRLR